MAATRVVTLTPNATAKSDWTLVGGASHHAVLSDSSDASYIESTTLGNIDRLDLTSYTLQPGEFVSGIRIRVRAATQTNHTVDVSVGPAAGVTAGGAPPYRIPQSQSIQQFTTDMFAGSGDPFHATASNRGVMTQTMLNGLMVQLVLNEAAAQAGTTKIYKLDVDLYISDAIPRVTRGPNRDSSRLVFDNGKQARFWGVNRGMDITTDSLATLKAQLLAHKNVGFNLFRLHVNTAGIKTAAGAGDWVLSVLGKLVELLQWMNDNELYADLVLNVSYRSVDNPAWYESQTETQRWDERRFVARQITGMLHQHPAVAWFCLINEGSAPTTVKSFWRLGDPNGSGDTLFSEYLVKDPAGRSQDDIWGQWLADVMSATDGVRFVNPECLVGCGAPQPYLGVGSLDPFVAVINGMDLILPHVYPQAGETWKPNLDDSAATGLPICLEEFFVDVVTGQGFFTEMDQVFRDKGHRVSAWIGQSEGLTDEEYVNPVGSAIIFQIVMRWYEARLGWWDPQPTDVWFDFDQEAPLNLNDGAGDLYGSIPNSGMIVLADPEPNLDPPPVSQLAADSHDTEGSIPLNGDPKYANREISFTIRVYGSNAEDLDNWLAELYEKLGKIHREGGTLLWVTTGGRGLYFDLTPETAGGVTWDTVHLRRHRANVEISLTARPFWRAVDEVELGTWTETTNDAVVFSTEGPDGDVPALGRLVVTDLSGNDQAQVHVGGQSRHFVTTAQREGLFFEGSDFTPLGTASVLGGTVTQTDLTPTWLAMIKSELDATNEPLTHKGSFRIKAKLLRSLSNTGEVAVRVEYGTGDFRNPDRSNSPVVFGVDDREGISTWTDLGLVHIPADAERWEFRILAKSTVAGDDISVQAVTLHPTDVVLSVLSGVQRFETPSVLSVRDEFNQAVTGGADPLTGLTLPVGGTWSGAGDADDFEVEDTGHTARRTILTDTVDSGRYVTASGPTFTDTVCQMDLSATGGEPITRVRCGLVVRYTDVNNWWMARIQVDTVGSSFLHKLAVYRCVAGSIAAVVPERLLYSWSSVSVSYRLRVSVAANGQWAIWLYSPNTNPGDPISAGFDSTLKTGGSLASGKVGIYDEGFGTTL